jgi:ppGpp synthetase/RelA/SpoT-type nucleotidyltranferase
MDTPESYKNRYTEILVPVAHKIEDFLRLSLNDIPHIDRISARAKTPEKFAAKAAKIVNGQIKYDDPINQIQDQVGARIIVFYEDDVDRTVDIVNRYLRPIEFKSMSPESHWTFGYFGRHFIFLTPTDIMDDPAYRGRVPYCFELQIKTLFQHAWSEANHDLGYKPGEQALAPEDERLLAFASAQAWGADKTFSSLIERMGKGNNPDAG